MKIHRKWSSFVFPVLAVLWMSGCQQAGNPVSSTSSQMGPSGQSAGVMPTATVGVKSDALLGGLLGPSVNCTQTCSSPSASLGASVTYSINLSISGGAASACQITDVLPAGMSYVQGTATTLAGGSFTCTGQTLTWVYNSLGPCNCVMTYVAKVNNVVGLIGSILPNTSVVTCGLLSAISSTVNLLVTCACTSTPTAAVSIPTPTFTCVPPTPTFTCVPPTATFTNTPVPPTSTFTFTPTNSFTSTPTSTNTPVPPTLTFTFTSTNSFTPVPPTNTFTAVPPPNTPTFTSTPAPVVSLSKTASELVALTGDVVTYTLHLNVSGSVASNLQIQDVLPSGCNFVAGSESDSLGAAFSVSGQTLTWAMSQAGPCSCSLIYQAKVNGLAAVGAVMTNLASLTCSSLSSPVSCLCNVTMGAPPVPTSTPIPIPTITLGQICSPASAAIGAAVTYTLNLGVTGCSCSANNVTIQDVLPAGLAYAQGTATTIAGGTFSASGQTLTWVYNSVGPCSCTMTYVAQVSNSLTGLVGSTLTNTAVLSCPSLTSALDAVSNLQVTGLLGGLGL